MIESFKLRLKKNFWVKILLVNPIKKILHYRSSRRLQKYGLKILFEIGDVLDKKNIFFWPEHGTLLGLIREGRLIKGDLDIDLAIFLDDYSNDIQKALETKGYKLVKEYLIDDGEYGREQTYTKQNINVDIFYFKKGGDYNICHCFTPFDGLNEIQSQDQFGGQRVIENYFLNLGFEKKKFHGMEFNIPNDAHKYLKHHYGESYMVPKKWDYTNTDKDNINAKYIDKIGVKKLYD